MVDGKRVALLSCVHKTDLQSVPVLYGTIRQLNGALNGSRNRIFSLEGWHTDLCVIKALVQMEGVQPSIPFGQTILSRSCMAVPSTSGWILNWLVWLYSKQYVGDYGELIENWTQIFSMSCFAVKLSTHSHLPYQSATHEFKMVLLGCAAQPTPNL